MAPETTQANVTRLGYAVDVEQRWAKFIKTAKYGEGHPKLVAARKRLVARRAMLDKTLQEEHK